jgi:catechol 2,3-dioxygenase-like lactoylglutathione lyase family enzyme
MSLSNHRVGAAIAVSDMNRAREFYEGKLGFAAAGDDPDGGRTYECAEQTTLHVFPSPDGAGASGATVAGWTRGRPRARRRRTDRERRHVREIRRRRDLDRRKGHRRLRRQQERLVQRPRRQRPRPRPAIASAPGLGYAPQPIAIAQRPALEPARPVRVRPPRSWRRSCSARRAAARAKRPLCARARGVSAADARRRLRLVHVSD